MIPDEAATILRAEVKALADASDNTAEHGGWAIRDDQGFTIGCSPYPSGEATLSGSGPCLPRSSGTPSPRAAGLPESGIRAENTGAPTLLQT